MSVPITVYVRDKDYKLLGQIDDYQSLNLSMRYNDVGSWEIVVPARSPGATLLDRATNPGGGIIVMRGNKQLMSGPARGHKWSRSGATGDGVCTVVGLSDDWILASHLVWPDPTATLANQAGVYWYSDFFLHAGTYNSAEYIMYTLVDYQMGVPGTNPARKVPYLNFAVPQDRGKIQLTPKWRFNTVLEALQQMSVLSKDTTDVREELGFKVAQIGVYTPAPKFEVFLSADKSSTVRFSFNVGNLAEAEYTTTAPKANFLITGAGEQADPSGSGAQINKQLLGWSRSDYYYPEFYAEGFLDASEVDPLSADATAQLQQGVDDFWDSNAGQVAATFKAIDTVGTAFGDDYVLGDFVTIELPQLTFIERIRGIGLSHTPDGGEEITIAVGTVDGVYGRLNPGRTSDAMFRAFKAKAEKAHRDAVAHQKHLAHMRHLAHLKHLQHLKNKKAKAKRRRRLR